MRILLTGASGFLGKYILSNFQVNHVVDTLGRNNNCHYKCNLANEIPTLNEKYDVVIHAAGKAHLVPNTQVEVDDFFGVNFQGTINLLKALEGQQLGAFIFISSVAVYGLNEGNNIPETATLQAIDPYGKSKIMAEEAVQDWGFKNNVPCTIFRLPLLIGMDAPGNLNAMINAIKSGIYFNISNGVAKKSMVLASEIPIAIEKAMGEAGIFNLTDGHNPSFNELSQLISKQLNRKVYRMPYWIAKIIAKIGDLMGNKAPLNTNKFKKITTDLTFDDTKAREVFGWNPTPVLEGFRNIH
ncbi:NAD-dependent epimerase/dehydratase family protein [Aquirufa sp. Wall-65K1]